MRYYANILVSVTLDERDKTTLAHVHHFVRAAKPRTVHLVHVVESPDYAEEIDEAFDGLYRSRFEDEAARLQTLAAEQSVLYGPETSAESKILQGSLVLQLMKYAVQVEPDLVVLAVRREEGKLGPSHEDALEILRTVPCPVFVVPEDSVPTYERILVPVDFSIACREALNVACAIAETVSGAIVRGLHVYSVPIGYQRTGRSYEQAAARMRALAESHWAEMRPEIDTRGVPFEMHFELGTNASESILNAAKAWNADLIVMSSRGRTQPPVLLVGRTAEIVCTRTEVPFLCVKKRGETIGLLEALIRFLGLK